MSEEKVKITFRMEEETNQMIKAIYKQDNCFSQNEFIEKAVRFYISYINTENSTEFLNPAIFHAIKAAIKESESRTATNIFRLAVEMSMMMNILAAGLEISDDDLHKLRGRCVNVVKQNKGRICMEDAIEYQNGGDYNANEF